ncbi:MAG: Pre-rRNA-processing protein ipi3 [Pycnora praestabilis]|nr:MAG: Pre-rRNA-processing protein ipi3 [Pycnora praestabilis]
MLSELLVTSLLFPQQRSSKSSVTKDAGIHVHNLQPSAALKSSFKKSSTPANCLAVSASHIFAAQAEKAVVHVYSREKGNQEAIIPFPERIHSLALAGDFNGGGVLLLATEGGRVILWELCTGRQISTPQSHLQPITCLAVDPTSNFLLSGSSDSNIHVWSLPALLSFSNTSSHDPPQISSREPLRTLSNHRAAITSLVAGHGSGSTNIAVSASQDSSCIVWDYHTGDPLRTFLLPSVPLSLTLDPADRAFYTGFEDGSIQLVDFFNAPGLTNPLFDPALQSTPSQPPASDHWTAPNQDLGSTLCLSINYEGNVLFSGHEGGKVISWDIAKGRYVAEVADYSTPVTNLHVLPPTGFPNAPQPKLKVHSVVKPRYESSFTGAVGDDASSSVPANYNFTAQFTNMLPRQDSNDNDFSFALTHPSIPLSLLEEGIAELASWNAASHSHTNSKTPQPTSNSVSTPFPTSDNIIPLDDTATHSETLEDENTRLRNTIAQQSRLHKRTMAKLLEWGKERAERKKHDREEEEIKQRRKKRRREKRKGKMDVDAVDILNMMKGKGRSEEGDSDGDSDSNSDSDSEIKSIPEDEDSDESE